MHDPAAARRLDHARQPARPAREVAIRGRSEAEARPAHSLHHAATKPLRSEVKATTRVRYQRWCMDGARRRRGAARGLSPPPPGLCWLCAFAPVGGEECRHPGGELARSARAGHQAARLRLRPAPAQRARVMVEASVV